MELLYRYSDVCFIKSESSLRGSVKEICIFYFMKILNAMPLSNIAN